MEKPKLFISHFPNGNWVVTGKKGAVLTSSCDDQAVTKFKNFNEISTSDLEAMRHNNFHIATDKIIDTSAEIEAIALPKSKILLQKKTWMLALQQLGPALLFGIFWFSPLRQTDLFFICAAAFFSLVVWPNLFDFLRKRRVL